MLIWIIESTLAGGILAGIAWIFSKRFRHMPALLHLAWFAVMVRLIMPPLPIQLPLSQTLHNLGQESLNLVVAGKPTHDAAHFNNAKETTPRSSITHEQAKLMPAVSSNGQKSPSASPHQTAPKYTAEQTIDQAEQALAFSPNHFEISKQVTAQDVASVPVPALMTPSEGVINFPQPVKITAWQTWPWASLLIMAWIVGSILILCINGFRMLAMRRTLAQAPFGEIDLINQVTAQAERMGIKPPAVVMLDHIATPFVWCLGRPILVWPRQLTPWRNDSGQAEMLIHELAHIKRRDHWFVWAELLIGTVLWWHPLLWIARARMRYYAELACDATVVNQTPHLRESYARALVSAMAQLPLSRPRCGALALGSSKKKAFEKRLAAIMNKKTTLKKPFWALVILATVALLVLPALKPRPSATPQVTAYQDVADDLGFLDKDQRDKVQARANYEMAKRYIDAEQWDRAEAILEKSIQLNPSDAHVWSKYGEVLLETGKYREAIAAFEKHNTSGGHSHGDLKIAQALAKGGHLEDAMNMLESLGRRGELNPESLGDTEFAALFDDPSYAQLTLRSVQYQKQSHQARKAMNDEEYREAATLFRGLTKIAPESSWVWDRLCYVLAPLKEYDQSEQALQRAMALTPEVPHLYYNQACIAVLRGNTSQAKPLIKKALDMGFDNVELMKKDTDLDPLRSKPWFKNLLAELEKERMVGKQIDDLHDHGRPNDMLEVLDAAAQLKTLDDKDHAYINRMRGLANLKLDRFEEAADAFTKQLSLVKSSKMKNPLYNLACAFAGQGRIQEGLASLKASMAVGYKNHHHMEKDKDLAPLRGDPAFMEMVQQAARERLLRRYDHTNWVTFETWVDEQLTENALPRKKLAKLSKQLYNAKAWLLAGKAYSHLSELDFDDHIPYNAACSYALAGETDLAFQWLEKAIAAGFHNMNHMHRDTDLESLKKDPRWKTIQDSL